MMEVLRPVLPLLSGKRPPAGRNVESGVRLGKTPGGKPPASTLERTQSPAVDLGRTARRLRESQNLTLADVARRAEISSAMLSRLETGRVSPSLETIVALARALGVTASALMQPVGADDRGAPVIRAREG